MSLPARPNFGEPMDPIPEYWKDKPGCDPTVKSGVAQFRDFILQNVGGGSLGIVRPCDVGGASHHHEGRAWDWAMDANDPSDAAAVDRTLRWLKDTRIGWPARRAGLQYIIWDGKIWGWDDPYSKPREYTGASPHRDHVHFSFTRPGAQGETSFYRWLDAGAPSSRASMGNAWPLAAIAVAILARRRK